jgi:hypothetical protein
MSASFQASAVFEAVAEDRRIYFVLCISPLLLVESLARSSDL